MDERVWVALARRSAVMPDHLAYKLGRRTNGIKRDVLCPIVCDTAGRLDQLIQHDQARVIVYNGHTGQLCSIFRQDLQVSYASSQAGQQS